MLTVSIPTYNTPPDLLDRAVRSVLQSPQVDRLVIVNDGGTTPRIPTDTRVVLYTLDRNHGRYFCDAIVTRAVDGWWSPHDADDWSEPDRWDGYDRHPAILAGHLRHRAGRTTPRPAADHPVSSTFTDVGHWCAGIYHVDRIAKAGGILPQFRVGFDTLFLLLVHLTGPVHVKPRTAYHYDRRHDSLTSCPQTGSRSPFRAAQAAQLRSLYQSAWKAHHNGGNPAVLMRRSVPDQLRAEVADHADRLRGVLC